MSDVRGTILLNHVPNNQFYMQQVKNISFREASLPNIQYLYSTFSLKQVAHIGKILKYWKYFYYANSDVK